MPLPYTLPFAIPVVGITVEDVADYTNGRLSATDPEVQRMLDAALAVARRYVGHHVSPPRDETVTLDGPDSRILWLPTMKLNSLASIIEDGITLDLTKIAKSAGDGPGLPRRVALRKKSKGYWSDEYSSIVVTMNHGFTDDETPDWRQAILAMVDQMSLVPVKAATGTSNFGMSRKEVDDVTYAWQPYAAMAEEVVFSVMHILDDYRLPVLEFL